MPNWTRLLTDSVKLGVSANHVIALRMAKLAHGDANIEAARGIMTGHAHLAPTRALGIYQKRVRKNLSRLSKKKK